MARLLTIDSAGKRETIELDPARRYTIGRLEDNDIVFADRSLSRRHAELVPVQGGWTIADCNSHNGTFLDGRRIERPEPLLSGSRVTLGRCAMELAGAGGATTDQVSFTDEPIAVHGTVIIPASDVISASTDVRATADERVDLEGRMKRLRIVERANLELLAHEPMDVLLPKILDVIAEAVHPDRVLLLTKAPDGQFVCRAFKGQGPVGDLEVSRTIARTVFEEQVSVLTSDALSDERFRSGQSIVLQGIRSVMAAPLWNNREVMGLIYADSRMASGLFDEEDLRLLTMLANIAAIQIENARLFEEQVEKQRFEKEARAAADIQSRLLPAAAPDVPGYSLVGHNVPCYEAGGDYYDFVLLGGDRLGIVLADVAGKGMGAAMLMAATQATYRARVDVEPDPQALARVLNEAVLRSSPSNRFATLFLIDLHLPDHAVRFVNAGHAPEPRVVRAGGTIERLRAGGLPLGMFPDPCYPVEELRLGAGDFVFVCSDGLTDTVDASGAEYGEERLDALLDAHRGARPEVVRTAIETELQRFASGAPQPDDLTFVIVQRER